MHVLCCVVTVCMLLQAAWIEAEKDSAKRAETRAADLAAKEARLAAKEEALAAQQQVRVTWRKSWGTVRGQWCRQPSTGWSEAASSVSLMTLEEHKLGPCRHR